MTDPPKRKRATGAGRKPTHGVTKIDGNIALTPDVRAFLKETGPSVGEAIETLVRGRREFKAWLKSQQLTEGGNSH